MSTRFHSRRNQTGFHLAVALVAGLYGSSNGLHWWSLALCAVNLLAALGVWLFEREAPTAPPPTPHREP